MNSRGDVFEARQKQFWNKLQEKTLDFFLLTQPADLAYLFDFHASAGWALGLEGQFLLLVDSRYAESARSEAIGCQIELVSSSYEQGLERLVQTRLSQGRLGIDTAQLSAQLYLRLLEWDLSVELVAADGLLQELRIIKDDTELERLETAFEIAWRGLSELQRVLRTGLSEQNAAALLEFECRKSGSEGPAFETIIASGPRSSRPHARSSDELIAPEDLVLIDFGVRYQGYCSDLTRTYCPAETPGQKIYDIVAAAQAAALAAIRPGIEAFAVDKAARTIIEEAGYGEYFGHSTGHGLGLQVHELPAISTRTETALEVGMVFTVEPGIYLPGQFGVRLEDAVVVTETGYRFLSRPSLAD